MCAVPAGITKVGVAGIKPAEWTDRRKTLERRSLSAGERNGESDRAGVDLWFGKIGAGAVNDGGGVFWGGYFKKTESGKLKAEMTRQEERLKKTESGKVK